MSHGERMELKLLATGIPGMDEILTGGLPEYSFNLIAGAPGTGKTTFVHQLMFANASAERPASYFTVLGEPPLKMLRYQQQMAFFDQEKIGTSIRFVDLSRHVLAADLGGVLEAIKEHIAEVNPAIVVVDSFRTMIRAKTGPDKSQLDLQDFLQRLALHLASWEATSFLVGEYAEHELHDNPLFTIADGIVWLAQYRERSSITRRLEVMKMRGLAVEPGLHTFRITASGIRVFPRSWTFAARRRPTRDTRVSTGLPALDALFGGGIPSGDATLVAGPSGTGKTVLATHFIAAGASRGERAVLAIFEEHPDDYLERASMMGHDLSSMIEAGDLRIIALRPLDLSADEILYQIRHAVDELDAARLVIDSLNGLELAIAPNYRDEFRDSLYRMIGALTSGGVSVVLTVEVTEMFHQLHFSPHAISFLAQNIVFFRYVEIDAQLHKVLGVVKMRRSAHTQKLHAYKVTEHGLEVGAPLHGYQGILTGVPAPSIPQRSATPGLTAREEAVLDALTRIEEATLELLAEKVGAGEVEVRAALDRLLQLKYVIESSKEGPVYRPIVRTSAR